MQLGLFLKPHAVNLHTVFNWVLGSRVSSVDCTDIIHHVFYFFFLCVRLLNPPSFSPYGFLFLFANLLRFPKLFVALKH